jgi:2,4-dienoyl-CoA reductase-like NADH-dependent reductase (Old Yellow Enzyme family)
MGRNFAPPRAATESDLKEIIAAFAHAAQFLEKAGFDGAELHGAHGYLIAQFLSLSTNNRTDAYGGSLQNRMRLLLEIAAAIKAVVSPSFVLGIKINSVEFENHGFQPEDAAVLVSELEKAEFDYVELSGGTYEAFGFKHARESSRKREGFFLDFAGQVVKPLSKTRAYITGGFKTVGAMVSALAIVDGIGLGRPVCHEIGFGKDVLEGKIAGAIKPGLDEQDFGATSGAAATNMRRVAEGKGVLDFSDEGVVKGFLETMAKMAKGAQSGVQEGGDVLVEVKA